MSDSRKRAFRMPPDPKRLRDEVDEELRFHLEQKAERLMRDGMSEADAWAEARRRFGCVDRVRSQMTREGGVRMRTTAVWERMRQDVQYATRQLIKSPGFTAVTVLTLSLGIGATTSIFSVVDGILFRPLPFPQPEELVAVWNDLRRHGGPPDEWMNFHNYMDLKERSRSLEAIGAWGGGTVTVTGLGDPEQIPVGIVTHDVLPEVLGVAPALGRGFAPMDDLADAPGTVLLTDGFWRRALGGDPNVLGEALTLNGEPYTVLGVLPQDFAAPFATNADVWLPIRADPSDPSCPRGNACLRVVARLADGATLQEAQAEAHDIGRQLATEYPETNADDTFLLRPLREDIVGDTRAGLLVLLGGVALVLLTACVNVANLLLARATTRTSEIAVRSALGASRKRILGQLLTESMLLASLGGGAGLALAYLGTDLLTSIAPAGTPRVQGISVDGRVLAFAIVVTALAGLVFGILPSLRVARGGVEGMLREGGRDRAGGVRGMRARGALVSGQVALAMMLLVGAALLARSLQNLRRTDLGYRPEGVLTMRVNLPSARYPDADALRAFVSGLDQRLSAVPGVVAQGGTSWLPLTGFGTDIAFTIEGQAELPAGQNQVVWFRRVTEGYPEAMGMRLIDGRWTAATDDGRAPGVVVINEAFARRYFPDGSPVGRRLNLGITREPDWWEIVGVAADARYFSVREGGRVSMYVSYAQAPARSLAWAFRSDRAPSSLAGEIRTAVAELDPALAVSGVQPMESVVADALGPEHFTTMLLGLFAAVALVLAVVGLYGVVSYGVSQRRREMGVRVALGAEAGHVRGLVLRQSLGLVAIGLAAGIGGGVVLTRAMSNLLYEVTASDPAIYGAVSLVLAAVATAASFIPAARAARVNPARVLRAD